MALALEDIKVIETATAAAGPLAGRLLGDYGADVIHIENPTRIALTRAQNDLVSRKTGKSIESDTDYRAQNHHRNKRGITLDLSQGYGREILYRMLEKADVWLSSFRPYELKKFNFEYETLSQLNPRLICANITSYGKKGPDADRPAYEHAAYFARPRRKTLRIPRGVAGRQTLKHYPV